MEKITLKDYIRHSKSPVVFMEDSWIGLDVFDGWTPKKLKPFEFQKDFIKKIHEQHLSVVVQSRQMHLTSMMALYVAWTLLFVPEQSMMVVTHNNDSAKRFASIVKLIIDLYVVDGRETIKSIENQTQTRLTMCNKSRLSVITPSAQAGRGERLDFLYIDNAAFMKNMEEIWMALGMALNPTNGKIVLSSTPKDDSWFNNIYLQNEHVSIKLHWSIHPVYNIEIKKDDDLIYEFTSPWFEEQKTKLYNYQKAIEQEFECLVKYKEKTNKNKTISLRISEDLLKKILIIKGETESTSDYIRRLIEDSVKGIKLP